MAPPKPLAAQEEELERARKAKLRATVDAVQAFNVLQARIFWLKIPNGSKL